MFPVRLCLASAVALALAGCASLPSSGPTAGQIERARDRAESGIAFKIIDLAELGDAAHATLPYQPSRPGLGVLDQSGRNDLIGPGDVLAINVFEIGTRLFGGKVEGEGPLDTSAQGQSLGEFSVQGDGSVLLPYVGRVFVAGQSVQDAQSMIASRMSRMSQFPQAVVTIKQNVSNTVFVSGEVSRAGRLPLTNSRERLLDVIAEAGGARGQPYDVIASITRGDRTVSQRLSEIHQDSADNLMLNPGDRISLSREPLTYSVLGAAQKVAQVPFDTNRLSLAEAVARAGGPSDTMADPSAVFLFRYEAAKNTSAEGEFERPTVYRLNMLQPASYLVAQRFMVQDKDVIYFANARANQPGKLAQIISQIFAPIFIARQVTN